jgi:hypothetical protein
LLEQLLQLFAVGEGKQQGELTGMMMPQGDTQPPPAASPAGTFR